jgi:hypothetical protein
MVLGVCIADPGGLVGLLFSSAAWPMPAPAIPKTIADAVASMRFLMDFTPSRRAIYPRTRKSNTFSLLRFRVMGERADRRAAVKNGRTGPEDGLRQCQAFLSPFWNSAAGVTRSEGAP